MAKKRKKKIKKKVHKRKTRKTTKKKVEGKPIVVYKKKKKNVLAIYSFILSIISLVVLVAYIIALIMSYSLNGSLLFFTYLAAMVVFLISFFGVALSTADLAMHPGNELSRKALYLNLVVLAVAFTLFMMKLF